MTGVRIFVPTSTTSTLSLATFPLSNSGPSPVSRRVTVSVPPPTLAPAGTVNVGEMNPPVPLAVSDALATTVKVVCSAPSWSVMWSLVTVQNGSPSRPPIVQLVASSLAFQSSNPPANVLPPAVGYCGPPSSAPASATPPTPAHASAAVSIAARVIHALALIFLPRSLGGTRDLPQGAHRSSRLQRAAQ